MGVNLGPEGVGGKGEEDGDVVAELWIGSVRFVTLEVKN